ncbi:MAG: HDOD domain-containing protein [Desulfobacterales bacterium]
MRFECKSCEKAYNIPDEKLPAKREISFPCPNCKALIHLVLKAAASPEAAAAGDTAAGTGQGAAENGEIETAELKRRVLLKLKDLPPMPQIVFKARQLIGDPDSEMKELATLLESDQGIAAKVLRLANSAYYGLSGTVSSIRHASALLGYKTLGELITIAATSKLMGKVLKGYGLSAEDSWEHSLAVATGSKILALRRRPELENDAFAAGLIHDAGKLILEPYVLDRIERFEAYTDGGRRSMLSAEQKILGFDHAEIGHEVCNHWKIPDAIAQAIRHHHQPDRSEGVYLAYIVSLADTIANISKAMREMDDTLAGMDGISGFLYMLDDEIMETLDMSEEEIPGILEEVNRSVSRIAEEMKAV